MAEMPNVDSNFEPQPRPRSGTWPMNRPNIPPRRRMQELPGTMLDTTLEEANSQELIAVDQNLLEPPPPIPDDYLQMLEGDSMTTDFDNVLMGLPTAPTASLVEDYTSLPSIIKYEPNNNSNILGEYCSTTTTITELSTLSGEQGYEDIQNIQQQPQSAPATNFSPGTGGNSSLSKSPPKSTAAPTVQPTTSGATPKAKSTRKNAWGNMSYADLITQAIESAPDKRLTLAQVYEWMVKNVPYFKDKGDSNSSAGWKNSIRHNLSLHAKFKRIQNEGTGKSSWWVINHDAKPGKSPRRRAISMDNQNAKGMRQRSKVAKQKADLLKKQKAGLKASDSSTWNRDGASGLETTVSKAMGSGYRVRASSNASSIGGRVSPSHLYPSQDLEDDGAPALSPPGSATNLANLSTSLPPAFDMFSGGRPENVPATVAEDGIPGDSAMQENLLEGLARMDVVSSPGPYSPVVSKAGMYLQQLNGGQQNSNRKNQSSNVAQNSPNLASLLQKTTKSPMKANTSVVTKREPDWCDAKAPYGYNPQLINPALQSHPQFKTPVQPRYGLPQQNLQETTRYPHSSMPQQGQVQQVSYIQPQPVEMQQYMINQQMAQAQGNRQMLPQYPDEQGNLLEMKGKFPSDINLECQDFYDSGEMDIGQVLVDIPPNDYPYDFSMDFQTGSKPAELYSQTQIQESNEYNMGSNGMIQQQQPLPPLAMHPNPDVFIANQGPGTISMGMMMDGCRMNNASFQRAMQSDRANQSVLSQHISSSRNAN